MKDSAPVIQGKGMGYIWEQRGKWPAVSYYKNMQSGANTSVKFYK